MSNIALNYIIINDVNKEFISKVAESCKSDLNSIVLSFSDFSLNKNVQKIVNENDWNDTRISVNNYDYEDSENAMNILAKKCIEYSTCDALAIVHQDLIFDNTELNKIDFSILNDESHSFLYGDYNIDGIRCFLRSHSANVKLSIPFVFWSMQKLLSHMSEENVLEYMFTNYMGLHIPQNICTIYRNEK